MKIKDDSITEMKSSNDISAVFFTNSSSQRSELYSFSQKQNLDSFFVKEIKNSPKKYSKTRILVGTEWAARRKKTDLAISFLDQNAPLNFAVKYKRRFKYIKPHQLAVLYINYLKEIDNGKSLKIFIPQSSTLMFEKVASGSEFSIFRYNGLRPEGNSCFGSDTIVFDVDMKLILMDGKSIKDTNDYLKELILLSKFLKSKKTDLYSKLKDLYNELGVHRDFSFSKDINEKAIINLKKSLKKTKKIADKKVCNYSYANTKGGNKVSLSFEDGSSVNINFKTAHIDVVIESVTRPGLKQSDAVYFEKYVQEFVKTNTEVFEDKSFSWKTVFKYSIYLGILVGIMFFVFTMIYNTTGNKNKNIPIFTIVHAVFSQREWYIWMTLWIWMIFSKFLGAWKKIRMFKQINVKVNSIHLVISAMMSSVIAFITPFAIGGDAIGYWYLRRKKVPREELIAVLASATLWNETKFALQTIFLFGIGYNLYIDIFNGDVQAKAALLWFFVGLAWSWFSAMMIMILTIHKRTQEFISRNTIKFLEWLPFVIILDAPGKAASAQYRFRLIRTGMKQIWNKWWFVLEQMFYSLLPLFFSPGALILATSGFINDSVPSGSYWSIIVANDIVGTANSMSILPGGSGTGEWLNLSIQSHLYSGSDFAVNTGYTAKTVASGLDLRYKIFYQWPNLLLSFISIILVLINENSYIKKRTTVFVRYTVNVISLLMFFVGLLLLFILF